MPPIYINTEQNPDPEKKTFNGIRAGGASKEVEDLMKKTIEDALVKNADFTTNKHDGAKGYTLKMKITEVTVDKDGNTTTKMQTIIERYPDGNMVSSGGESTAKLGPPADKAAILECTKAMVKGALEKSLPKLKEDMAKFR